jgi:hypothetical protein
MRNRLVFAADHSWIEWVMVNGHMVLEQGRASNVDEVSLLRELEEYLPTIDAEQLRAERRHRHLIDPLREMDRLERGAPLVRRTDDVGGVP